VSRASPSSPLIRDARRARWNGPPRIFGDGPNSTAPRSLESVESAASTRSRLAYSSAYGNQPLRTESPVNALNLLRESRRHGQASRRGLFAFQAPPMLRCYAPDALSWFCGGTCFRATPRASRLMAGLEQQETVALGRAAVAAVTLLPIPLADRRFLRGPSSRLAQHAAWPEDLEDALPGRLPEGARGRVRLGQWRIAVCTLDEKAVG
jgi:hypothetical protein